MGFTWDFEKFLCVVESLLQIAQRKDRPYNAPHGSKKERWTSFFTLLLRNACFLREAAPNLETVKVRVADIVNLAIEMEV